MTGYKLTVVLNMRRAGWHTRKMSSSKAKRQLPSILLIEDDVISREVMQMTLEMHGLTVSVAEDGAAALAILTDSTVGPSPIQPGLILMDSQMPGLSGAELVSALRERTDARIVAISASEPAPAIRQAADAFLLKPVQVEDLLAWLEPKADKPVETELKTVQATAGGTENPTNPIDPSVLGKLKAMMPASSVREIYVATAADLDTRLAALQAAMDGGNAAEVKRIAHAIKGGCAMVGLTGAREAASRLETIDLPVTWSKELMQLRFALSGLKGMLGDDFPA
jgi:CheY-like chemotaxis protein